MATNESDRDIFPGILLTSEQRRALSQSVSARRNPGGDQKPIEILTYGGGAMGALYSWIISLGTLHPVNFTMVCRSNYPTVSTTGFTIDSFLFGPGTFKPQTALQDLTALPSPPPEFDLILICTKSSPHVVIPPHVVTPGKTAIALFQNGINIEAPYKLLFPNNTIISAVLYVSCGQPEPGKIVHVGHIDIVKLGVYPEPPGGKKEEDEDEEQDRGLALLTSLLQAGGCNATATPHIQSDRWLKTVWNGCWNVLCAVTGLDTHELLASSPRSREMARNVTRELVGVARRALGVVREDGRLSGEGEVPKEVFELWGDVDKTVERNIRMAERAVPIVPSMLWDARKGCEMEVEAFCGEVVRTGERAGVEMPVLKTLYPVLLAMNYRFMRAALPPSPKM